MSGEDVHDAFADDPAAYVLGALTEPEEMTFAAHLQTCSVCRDRVASLQSVASALPAAVQQHAAPREIKDRVMVVVEREAGLRGPSRSPDGPTRAIGRSSHMRARALLGSVAAAAAIVVAVGVVWSGRGGNSARVIRAHVALPHASALVHLSGGHAELDVAGLPQASPGRVYEVWIGRGRGPQPTNALFTVSSSGKATVGVPGSIKGVQRILVTAEPRGGSRRPTSNPVIVADL